MAPSLERFGGVCEEGRETVVALRKNPTQRIMRVKVLEWPEVTSFGVQSTAEFTGAVSFPEE
jgi:hypothetical protein